MPCFAAGHYYLNILKPVDCWQVRVVVPNWNNIVVLPYQHDTTRAFDGCIIHPAKVRERVHIGIYIAWLAFKGAIPTYALAVRAENKLAPPVVNREQIA